MMRGQKESSDTVPLAADCYVMNYFRRFPYINSVNKQFTYFFFFNNCSNVSYNVLRMLSLNKKLHLPPAEFSDLHFLLGSILFAF